MATTTEEPVDISIRTLQGVHVMRLNGKLHLGEPVDTLRATLDELVSSGESHFVLDLAGVPVVDSSGIGALVRTVTNLKQQGGDLKLVNPSKFVVQTLRMLGVLNLFQVYQDESAAVQAFN
jgi:anti-sigma B factor antagonist